ncbi:MAG: hypothetical protein AABN95_20575 [Acidobacteriota bacterium]
MSFLDKLFSRLEKKTVDRTSNYFRDAILVYSGTRDPVVRMAALAAAKKASRDERASMVNFVRDFASDEDEDLSLPLNQLADEILLRDWTIRDAVAEGLELAKLDEEFAIALDKFDARVFRRRFPELFSEEEHQ